MTEDEKCGVCAEKVGRTFVTCCECRIKVHFGKCSKISSQAVAKTVAESFKCPECGLRSDLAGEIKNLKTNKVSSVSNVSTIPTVSVASGSTVQSYNATGAPPVAHSSKSLSEGTKLGERTADPTLNLILQSADNLNADGLNNLSHADLVTVAKSCSRKLARFEVAFIKAKEQVDIIASQFVECNMMMKWIMKKLGGEEAESGDSPIQVETKKKKKKNKNKKKKKESTNGSDDKVVETPTTIKNSVDSRKDGTSKLFGTGTEDMPFQALPIPEPVRKIYIGRIVKSESVSCDGLRDYLKSKANADVRFIKQISKDETESLAFVVGVLASDYDKVMKNNLWPAGTLIRDYVYYPKKSKN